MSSDSDSDSNSDSDSDDSSNHIHIPSSEEFQANLLRIRENDPRLTRVNVDGDWDSVQNMTNEDWEELGRNTSNNTYLQNVYIVNSALNNHTASCFFRGLTRSSSILELALHNNTLSGVQFMMPFLQNANNLICLYLNRHNLQSEGFNLLLRSLHDSLIEELIFW